MNLADLSRLGTPGFGSENRIGHHGGEINRRRARPKVLLAHTRIWLGTNGNTADTQMVTQSFGSQGGQLDDLNCFVKVTFYAVGASGSFFWSIGTMHSANSGQGFGLVIGSGTFSGTLSAVNTTISGLIFGIGLNSITTNYTTTYNISYITGAISAIG